MLRQASPAYACRSCQTLGISEFRSLAEYENESTAGLSRRGCRNGWPGLPVRWRSANLGRFRHRHGWPLLVAPARILWHRTVANHCHRSEQSFSRPKGTCRCRSAQPCLRADSHRQAGVCRSCQTLGISEFSSPAEYENESTNCLSHRGCRRVCAGLPVRWRSANLGRFRNCHR